MRKNDINGTILARYVEYGTLMSLLMSMAQDILNGMTVCMETMLCQFRGGYVHGGV